MMSKRRETSKVDIRKSLIVGASALCLAIGAGVAANAGSSQKSGHGAEESSQGAKASDHGSAKKQGKSTEHVATSNKKSQAGAKKKSAGHGGTHWTYEGAGGPSHWGDMSPKFRLCKSGIGQSPIDLNGGLGAMAEPIQFNYQLTPLTILHNGHTVQVNYKPGSSMTVAGKTYELLQFHFHGPSEHEINGKQTDMEMHLVHKSADGQLAVVGVMIKAGADNMGLNEILQHMPTGKSAAKTNAQVMINARDLLPNDQSYYRYVGSLTTPPCSEGVQWHVIKQPVTISRQTVRKFNKAVGMNARPVQALNNRLLLQPVGRN